MPSLSFITSANAVRNVGASPIFADVDIATQNLTAEFIGEAITDRTRAVMLVHQLGLLEIRERKKTGFPVPYERWISESATGSLGDLLLDDAAIGRGYFQKPAIEALLRRSVVEPDVAPEVFSLIVLELWHRLFVDADSLSNLPLA